MRTIDAQLSLLNTPELTGDQVERLKKVGQAASQGRGYIYLYNSSTLSRELEDRKAREAKNPAISEHYSPLFEPNPFIFQYDLEVYLFLNYKKLTKKAIAQAKTQEERDWLKENGVTGIPRWRHANNFLRIRFPETTLDNGRKVGSYIANPWGDDRLRGLSYSDSGILINFGGSGQGKTHTFLAFGSCLWDHFIYTEKGGRFCISTVSEDKLSDASWSYLVNSIYPVSETRRPFSLYAGLGREVGDYNIVRPGKNKKDGGKITGILCGVSNEGRAKHKLTGSHGHPVRLYLLDEAQATPDYPLKTWTNQTQHCQYSFLNMTGNYVSDSDTLGRNSMPKQGWDSVDAQSKVWVSETDIHIDAVVIHHNNDHSPALTKEGEEKWGGILPTQKKKDAYKGSSEKDEHYRTFWQGFRSAGSQSIDTVISPTMIRDNRCHEDPDVHYHFPTETILTFDPSNGTDRMSATIMKCYSDMHNLERKIGIIESRPIVISDARRAYSESIPKVYEMYKEFDCDALVLDWSQKSSHREGLEDLGANVVPIRYGLRSPSGENKDPDGNIMHRLLLQSSPQIYLHTEAYCIIDAAALLLRKYTLAGMIRGFNSSRLLMAYEQRALSYGMDKEFYLRRIEPGFSTTKYGKMFKLTKKQVFTKEHKFSPDILDTIMQGCYYFFSKSGLRPERTIIDPDDFQYDGGQLQKVDSYLEDLDSTWDQGMELSDFDHEYT